MPNNFSNKISILSELWMNYRDDEQMQDFIEYNDLGLPAAYFAHTKLMTLTDQAEMFINETYDLFIASLEAEDKEYESLDELLGSIPE